MSADGPTGDTDGSSDGSDDGSDDWSDWLTGDPSSPWDGSGAGLVFDDTDDDPTPTAPLPLHPDDRLWRHPSEVKYDTAELAAISPDDRRMSLRMGVGVALLAGLSGAMIASIVMFLVDPGSDTVVERVVERQAVPNGSITPVAARGSDDVSAIADEVTPSIVRVEVASRGQLVSSGSGVLIRDDGHLLTNAHVVDDASEIRVVLADGRILDARVVGADPLTDVAVVLAELAAGESLPPAVLGATTGLRPGQMAIAIGSPLRLQGGPTVTLGVISALGRRLQAENGEWLYNLVQTDAPISPGSSGGALLDENGAVIGITTAIAVSDVGAEGLGFATPIEVAKAVADDLIRFGEPRHGLIGMHGEDAAPALLDGSRFETGVVVREVDPDGPAAAGGLTEGDVVVELDDSPVESMIDLVVRARLLDPGAVAELTVLRDGQLVGIELTAGQLP